MEKMGHKEIKCIARAANLFYNWRMRAGEETFSILQTFSVFFLIFTLGHNSDSLKSKRWRPCSTSLPRSELAVGNVFSSGPDCPNSSLIWDGTRNQLLSLLLLPKTQAKLLLPGSGSSKDPHHWNDAEFPSSSGQVQWLCKLNWAHEP